MPFSEPLITGVHTFVEVQVGLCSLPASTTESKPLLLRAPFKLSELSTYEMKRNNGSSAAKNAWKESSRDCIHPEEMRIWDPRTGEVICRRCGEVIGNEPVMVPKIRHDEKLQTYLNRTKLNIGTLPPEGRERTEITVSNIAAKICSDLALPKHIVDQAAAHARRILRASRGAKHRVTLNEAAVAGVICACKESRHPYSLKRIAEAVGMDPNGVYRLLARISRFYQLPQGIISPERYVRFIGARLANRGIDPHYLSLTEQYACSLLRMEGEAASKAPLFAAAEALVAADERMAHRIGRERIAEEIGAVANGSFTKSVRRLKNSQVTPPVEAMEYLIQAFWED